MNDRLRPNPPLREKKVRSTPKGRRVDPQALADVRALLGDAPRRRDLLIEHLHKIQDRFGCLSAAHLVALAAEMKLAMTEVYEVATFYHHFDVVKDGEPRRRRSRCASAIRSRASWRASHELLERLPKLLGAGRARARGAVRRPLRAGAGRRSSARTRSACDRRHGRGARAGGARRSIRSARSARRIVIRTRRRRDARVRRLRRVPRGRRLRPARRLPRPASATPDEVIETMETRACAAWAAPAFPPGASGGSCAPSRRRG